MSGELQGIDLIKALAKNTVQLAKQTPLFSSWRAFKYTEKGMKAGNDVKWDLFMTFYHDMVDSHFDGAVLCRLDKTKPFSKDNCIWVEKSIGSVKPSVRVLEYNGKSQSLKEWSSELGIPLTALTNRYHKGRKRHRTAEDILFGITKQPDKPKKSAIGQKEADIKIKASKMVSAYRCKDNKRGFNCNLTKEWFIDNIILKPCSYCGDIDNVGCDRVDNSKGHTMDNVVPCCYRCNVIRSNFFSVDEMKEIGMFVKTVISKRK